MGEADTKKSFNPCNTILLFTFVLGFSTSISCFNLGIVSKKSLIFSKFFCVKSSKKDVNSFSVESLAGYIFSPSKIWSIQLTTNLNAS